MGGWTDESAMVAMQVSLVCLHGGSIGKTDEGGNTLYKGSGGGRDNVKEVAGVGKK